MHSQDLSEVWNLDNQGSQLGLQTNNAIILLTNITRAILCQSSHIERFF